MAGSDTRVLATVPHAFIDITSVGGEVLQCLPIVQCTSTVETVDEGPIVLIMSQYAHKPIPNPSTPSPKLNILED